MPGSMTLPTAMYSNVINGLKGWPSPYAVDKAGLIDPAMTGMVRGRTIYLNPAIALSAANERTFSQGGPADTPVCFALQGQNDPDANSYVGNISGGHVSGLSCLGAFELETSEFVAGAYPPNTPLQAVNVGANIGRVNVGVFYTNTIVGIVSDGQITDQNGVSRLRFWTYFLPHYGD